MKPDCLLIRVLRNPEKMLTLDLREWNVLLPQAHYASLSAILYKLADRHDLLDRLPVRPLQHLKSAWVVHLKQRNALNYEKKFLLRAFSQLAMKLVFLKGAAYHFAGIPLSEGRLLSDLDLLVPKDSLAAVEAKLGDFGWRQYCEDEYDERYFREWMHEIPPLSHGGRGSTLDVHHNILPPTAKYNPDAALIFNDLRRLDEGVYVLSPQDMVIHSATHLFHEGEFEQGLRGIFDLYSLLAHYSTEPGFWERLVPRAVALDLVRPLYYGLHYARIILGAEVPARILEEVEVGRPSGLMSPVMDFMFQRALMPHHPSCDTRFTRLSRFLLFIRSHYLKMPLKLLIPHLVRKAWRRVFPVTESKEPKLEV